MSREGLAPNEPVMERRKGRLKNVGHYSEPNGLRYFVCDCDCGLKGLEVSAKAYNDGKVTACPQCTSEGLAPDLYPNRMQRRTVSFDPEVFATLGYDLEVEGNLSGAVARRLLEEFALLVSLLSSQPDLTPKQWQMLRTLTPLEPEEWQRSASAWGRYEWYRSQTDTLPELTAVEAQVVISALRWVKDHPDSEGWYDPDVRTGGA